MIWLILILSLILRSINLNQSLWWDEAINVVYAKSYPFWWYITEYPVGDFHPPGYFALLWIWGHIFGFSEIMVRLPSVILGVATVWLTYLLGKELFNKKTALIGSMLIAIAPLHVYYSQEARMYAFVAFSVTLSFYFLNKIFLKKKGALIGYIMSIFLILYSDYLAYLVIPSQLIYLVWSQRINKEILFSLCISSLTIMPWFSIFLSQLQLGITTTYILSGWREVVGGSEVKDLLLIPLKIFFGRVTFLDRNIYIVLSIVTGFIFSLVFFFGIRIRKLDQETKFLLSWLFIPLVLAFVISFFIPVLSYFRITFILPAFYLVLARGIQNLPKKLSFFLWGCIFLISLLSLFAYYINPAFQREDWRGAISFISKRLDNQSLVVFENNEIPAPVRYYSSDLTFYKPGLSEGLDKDLDNVNKIYLFEYLVEVYDPVRTVESTLKELNYVKTQTFNFDGVGFVHFYTK